MSKESYARGFVKAAAAAGVDPIELAKYAAKSVAAERDTDEGKFPELIQDTSRDEWELGRDVPAVSNPSSKDWTYLASLSPARLQDDFDEAGLTLKDFAETLHKISPEHAVRLMSRERESDFDIPLSSGIRQLRDRLHDRVGLNRDLSVSPSLSSALFSTATNLLDRAGQKTGRPLWDVKNVRPTLYGVISPSKAAIPAKAIPAKAIPAKK